MVSLMRYLRLETRVTTADKARILVAYLMVAAGLAVVATSLAWAVWPYDRVRWEGVTEWAGPAPVVTAGQIADVTFIVPYVCNEEGYSLTFDRWVVSGPRDEAGSYFRWEIDGAELVNAEQEPYCLEDLPVRVMFPAVYMPGEYHIEIESTYRPNPMFPRTAGFESPTFTVAAP